MQIVIKISEKVYNALTHKEFDASLVVEEMKKSIANGTPLPKGHGALIDKDTLYEQFEYNDYDFEETLEYATVIIPADTESEE